MPGRGAALTGLVRLADVAASPWRNGGGTTRTLAVWPPDAAIDGFDVRLSVADVASNGPFSPFPGVDRVLVLLEGGGMDLASPEGSMGLDGPGAVARFPGESAVHGRLRAGPTRDLNVMVRRDAGSAEVSVERAPSRTAWDLAVGLDGDVRADGIALGSGDLCVGPERLEGAGRFVGIRLHLRRSP